MALMRFFKPKWQHPDPEVRRQAVQVLTSDDVDILTRVACEDDAPAVRRLAIRRLNDLESLHRVSETDNDKHIRQFAHTRLSELLAGTRENSPSLDIRMDFLSRYPETKLLEFVALNGIEQELRRSVQHRISRQTVLRDIAITDAALENRMNALERISEASVLEAIVRQTRKRDKQIYRQSRLRLDSIRDAQERPARVKAECEQICTLLETMGQGADWQKELHQLQRLENRWQAINNEAEPVYQTRYERSRDAFLKASELFRVAREAEEQKLAGILASRQAILAQLADRKAQLLDTQSLSEDAQTEIAADLESWCAAWNDAGELPASQARPQEHQFTQQISGIRQRLLALRQNREMEIALQLLINDAEQLLGSKQPVGEQEVKSLEKRCKKHNWPADAEILAEGRQHFEALDQQLRKRLAHQRQQRQAELERLPGMLEQLEALLKQQTLKEAGPMHDRIQNSIRHLQALGVSGEQLDAYTGKLHSLTPRVMELQSWRSWGADDARQRLCTEMESLSASQADPADLAVEIRRLRREWEQLRSDGGAGFKTLRKRFDKAATEAFKPCEIFFKQQAEERSNNLGVKHALLQQLESFLASADWSHMDWKAAVKFQRKITSDWRQAGPVDRRVSKQIEGKYRSATGVLNEYLSMERERNLALRNTLIERVRGLLDIEDVDEAIDECKRIQSQWTTSVPGTRQQENNIWQEFREQCDAVFQRRKQQQGARLETEKQNKANRQQLCEQLEALMKATITGLDEATRQSHRIADEWERSGPVAKRDSPVLEKRFTRLQNKFRTHAATLREEDAKDQLEQLRIKAGYCVQLEELLEHPDPAVARSTLETLDRQWREDPALKDSVTQQAIQARYEATRCALLESDEQRKQLLSDLEANLDRKKELCLRMEILTGVESPAEAQQARLEFQANRLTETIGQGSQDPVGKMAEIRRDWYLSGVAPSSMQKILQARFKKALQPDNKDRN